MRWKASKSVQKKAAHSPALVETLSLGDGHGANELAARNVIAGCAEGDTVRTYLAMLKRYAKT